MIRRHPHVFGTEAERAAGVTPGFWDRAKDKEKPGAAPAGVLDDVPVALPALTRAIKLQNKAAKVGFDWPSLAPVFDKLNEEIAELEAAIADSKEQPDRAAIEEEFGDLLFVVANVARHLKLDPEAALRARQREVHPPLPLHRGAARRARLHPGAIGPRRDGRPVGRGEGQRPIGPDVGQRRLQPTH